MQGFPNLQVLIVDVGHANDFEELYPFLQKCPNIKWLKLHRCPFSDEQMRQIFEALPHLQRLDMKPSGNTPGKNWSYQSLAMLKDYPNLRFVRLIHGDALPLPWEDGLEHLAIANHITHIEWPTRGSGPPPSEVDVAKLRELRPNLVMLSELEREEMQKARRVMQESVDPFDFDWAIGPN